MEYANKVIVTDCITGLGTEEYVGYLFHGLCIGGRCLFAFNEKEFEMMRGSYAIIRKTEAVHNVRPSKDFRCPCGLYLAGHHRTEHAAE